MATNVRSDRALKIQNARILTGVYFGLLAVVFTLLLDATIYLLGLNQILPLFEGTLLAMLVATVFGMLFGEKIVHAKSPFKRHVFIWGWLMTLLALPVYDLGFLLFYVMQHADFIVSMSLMTLLQLYGVIFLQSFVLIGFWLAIIAGFAAIYLRARLVYYIIDSSDD